jgi:peptide/nickel transport system ATP-binding protein
LEVREVTKIYGGGEQPPATNSYSARVLDRVSFSIERGETLGLVGESGSGKSTIAKIILGLLPPTSGDVIFDHRNVTRSTGHSLRELRRRFQPVFQDPFAALNPRMTVKAILQEPFQIHSMGLRGRALADEVLSLLTSVGLDASALPRFPHEFSGGQRQRINIARALALKPELLILDEPVSALDVSVGAQIMNLLRKLQTDYKLTYLFISHSLPLVRYLSTKIAVLEKGRIIETGESEKLCQEPRETYTQNLLRATPKAPSEM